MGASSPFPSTPAIARAELFTHERFVYDGEALEDALSPGGARRRALDAAIAEMEAGAKQPSIEWRRNYSLLLGLERLLSEDEPHLADGAVLSAHQVDALSGTLIALAALECFDVVGGERVAAGAPLVAGDLLDHAPDASAHVLALDLDQCVGEPLDDLLLPRGGEDALDDFDLDQRHAALLVGRIATATIVRPDRAWHIGQSP